MIIDCDSCEVRGAACGDCVIGVLMGAPAAAAGEAELPAGVPPGAPIVQFDAPERRALAVLADQGLVPRLRLVAPEPRRASTTDDSSESMRDAG
ncbi:hypothetical protein [Pseudonocardia lacus]|uniref:hypothetical protein n=1 Tax=Pseudonocardia lacus TaxID=2835865 RepID=UPI001BDD534A|nr:hypothetical protein [Pseudonocardia lacus]